MDKLQIYETVSDALGRRGGESLRDAALRVMRSRGRRRPIAAHVIANGDKRDQAAWDSLADAADMARELVN